MSMPSSRVDVDTMTQSRASAKARSLWRRSSSDSDECEMNVVTPFGAEPIRELLGLRTRLAENEPLLTGIEGRNDDRGVFHGADVV